MMKRLYPLNAALRGCLFAMVAAVISLACSGSDATPRDGAPDEDAAADGGSTEGGPCDLPTTVGWNTELVAEAMHYQTVLAGINFAFALHGSNPGIVLRSETHLLMAVRDGGVFKIEEIVGLGRNTPIYQPVLRFQDDGTPVLGMATVNSFGRTFLMRRSEGVWSEDEVWPDPHELALALAPGGAAEVLTMQSTGIYHSRFEADAWASELVASSRTEGGTVGVGDAAFTIDTSGARHVAYRNGRDELFYATNSPDGWALERVAENTGDQVPEIAIDGTGTRFIAYVTAESSVAVSSGAPGGAWTSSVIGARPSDMHYLLADDQGELWLAWHDEEAEEWHLSRPDGSGERTYAGLEAFLAIAGGQLHAVYIRQNGFPLWDVCYATRPL